MKLKKIASLMLAGIMAVSMLAGCSNGNSNSGNNGGETNTATGVAAAFNDAQVAGNKAKIAFVSDSALDSDLALAVQRAGQGASDDDVQTWLQRINGIIPDIIDTANFMDEDKDCETGKTVVYMDVVKVGATAALTEEAAVKLVAKEVNTKAAALKSTTYVENTTPAGHTYYDFGYTGEASMVSVKTADGTVDYYFAIIVTQTCTAKTK